MRGIRGVHLGREAPHILVFTPLVILLDLLLVICVASEILLAQSLALLLVRFFGLQEYELLESCRVRPSRLSRNADSMPRQRLQVSPVSRKTRYACT